MKESLNKFFKDHQEIFEKIEYFNTKLIPFAIVTLLIIIILELFIHIENHAVELIIHIADYLVIAIFVVDLIFLAVKAKTTSFFFKRYWLDLLAIFPFGVLFNAVEKLYRGVVATERLVVGQAIAHETLEVRKGVSAAARSGRIAKFIRIIARSIRIITKSRLFTRFRKHHRKAHKKVYGKNKL